MTDKQIQVSQRHVLILAFPLKCDWPKLCVTHCALYITSSRIPTNFNGYLHDLIPDYLRRFGRDRRLAAVAAAVFVKVRVPALVAVVLGFARVGVLLGRQGPIRLCSTSSARWPCSASILRKVVTKES